MSSLKEQIEVDIKRFLENIDSQSANDKVGSLRTLLDKYLHLTTCDYMMDYHDFRTIISGANSKFQHSSLPVHIGKKKQQVRQEDFGNFCVIEATISHLNKNDCLKKLAKFDKREDKFEE
jgi:hypothetical protein